MEVKCWCRVHGIRSAARVRRYWRWVHEMDVKIRSMHTDADPESSHRRQPRARRR